MQHNGVIPLMKPGCFEKLDKKLLCPPSLGYVLTTIVNCIGKRGGFGRESIGTIIQSMIFFLAFNYLRNLGIRILSI